MPREPSTHGGGSDIYAIAYVAIAQSRHSTPDANVGVFAVVHADGAVALVHPDTGHAVARYPDWSAVTIVGSADVIGDPSLVWIGLSKKRGTKCYRAVSRSAATRAEGEHTLPAPVPPASPYDVVLSEVCTLGCTGEAVVALSAAVARHMGALLVAAFDTASSLRLWQLGSGPSTDSGLLQATLLDAVQEAVPIYCMSTVRNRDLWCGFEDGTVAVYRLPTTRPKKGTSVSPLSSPDRGPSARDNSDGHDSARPGRVAETSQRSTLVERMRHLQAAPCGVISMATVHRGSRSVEGHWDGPASVVMGTEHGDILVWSSVDYTLRHVLRECHTSAIAAMCAVPSLRQVWSLSTDRTLMIWNVANHRTEGASSEAETISKLLDVSLVGDITGSIFCLCYAAVLDTVAGGGSNSELLTWYPRDMAARLQRDPSRDPEIELNTDSVAPDEGQPSPAIKAKEQTAIDGNTTGAIDHTGGGNDAASPIHEPQPHAPHPTPSAQRGLAPLAQQLQLDESYDDRAAASNAPRLGDGDAQLRQTTGSNEEAPLEPGKAASLSNAMPQQTSPEAARVNSIASAALIAKEAEHQRLLEYIVQLKEDHAQEVATTRQAFADEFQVEVERLRHNSNVTLRSARAQSEALQHRLNDEAAAHAETQHLLRIAQEALTAVQDARDQTLQSHQWSLQVVAAERDAAQAAKEEALMLLDKAYCAFAGERELWKQGREQYEGVVACSSEGLSPQGAPVALHAPSTSPPDAVPSATASVSRLLEALTAEVRFLKQRAKAHRGLAKRSEQREASTQVDEAFVSLAIPVVGAQDVEYRGALAAERDALRYQLEMVEQLLWQQQRRCLGPHGSSAETSADARRSIAGEFAASAAASSVPTNALTGIYFTIRDVLGAPEASRMVHDVLSDGSLDEEEVTELLVRQLCYRVAAAHRPADTMFSRPQQPTRSQHEHLLAAADRRRGRAEGAPATSVTMVHPLLRGLSQSPPRWPYAPNNAKQQLS